jgi:2-polyprenyl-3-methyl-5-hydroxy-6-metoxy-1,4-benzoquinol methylase
MSMSSASGHSPGSAPPWNHNLQFHRWIVDCMPASCDRALDVGCGDGVLVPKLAASARHVTGIDVSAEMIAVARRNVSAQNVDFIEGDFLSSQLAAESFDFVTSVAAIHHAPFEAAIVRMANLLRIGGALVVVGLARNQSLADYAVSALSAPVATIARLGRGWWDSPALRIDPVMSYSEIKRAATALVPGVQVRRRLYFRYTLLWHKR